MAEGVVGSRIPKLRRTKVFQESQKHSNYNLMTNPPSLASSAVDRWVK